MAVGQVDGCDLVVYTTEGIGINRLYSQINIIAVDNDGNAVCHLNNAVFTCVVYQHDLIEVNNLVIPDGV